MTQTQIRVVAGTHKGRLVSARVHESLRPTPQFVREALFSILGNAVPDRPFFDVFAGTGINGLEALSRGASRAQFIERDSRLASALDGCLQKFGLEGQGEVIRADVYRWAERWRPPAGPANVFLSPPFRDLIERLDVFNGMLTRFQQVLPVESVLIAQLEDGFPLDTLPDAERWDVRKYGRNILAFWEPPTENPAEEGDAS